MRIELRGLTKRFADGAPVLDAVTYEDDIRTLAVIGPSGGGKSTLLRIIDGLIPASGGEVFLGGSKLVYEERALLAHRRSIGYVFQSRGLFDHLTGLENIALPLVRVHGLNRADAADRAKALLGRFGLLADAHKRPHELSGGQQQRIAIARAIAPRPKLLLLDEPTSALDPELTNEVLDMIHELRDDNLSIVVVTHEMGFAKNACDKLIFLSGGKLLEHGNSRERFANPRTAELRAFLEKILEWDA